MREEIGEARVVYANKKLDGITASGETFVGKNYFFAAGPWTQRLVEQTSVPLPMQPVRGQIALYKVPPDIESTESWPIVNEGSRYLVPRRDGHVLAGATIEEVGFDCATTEHEIAELRAWAESLCDRLKESTYLKSWAGLRPGTYDGFAYLGRLGDLENAFVATGHFKGGLHLSTGTAVVMADLAEGKTPSIDLQPFSPSRAANHQSTDIK
jgi:glycine oxidase